MASSNSRAYQKGPNNPMNVGIRALSEMRGMSEQGPEDDDFDRMMNRYMKVQMLKMMTGEMNGGPAPAPQAQPDSFALFAGLKELGIDLPTLLKLVGHGNEGAATALETERKARLEAEERAGRLAASDQKGQLGIAEVMMKSMEQNQQMLLKLLETKGGRGPGDQASQLGLKMLVDRATQPGPDPLQEMQRFAQTGDMMKKIAETFHPPHADGGVTPEFLRMWEITEGNKMKMQQWEREQEHRGKVITRMDQALAAITTLASRGLDAYFSGKEAPPAPGGGDAPPNRPLAEAETQPEAGGEEPMGGTFDAEPAGPDEAKPPGPITVADGDEAGF